MHTARDLMWRQRNMTCWIRTYANILLYAHWVRGDLCSANLMLLMCVGHYCKNVKQNMPKTSQCLYQDKRKNLTVFVYIFAFGYKHFTTYWVVLALSSGSIDLLHSAASLEWYAKAQDTLLCSTIYRYRTNMSLCYPLMWCNTLGVTNHFNV